MSLLPDTGWDGRAMERRLDFLTGCLDFDPADLLLPTTVGEGVSDQTRFGIRIEIASLCLISNQTERGLNELRSGLDEIQPQMWGVREVLLGALLGRVIVRTYARGAEFRLLGRDDFQSVPIFLETEFELASGLPTLFLASLVSGNPDETLPIIQDGGPYPPGVTAALDSPEFGILSIFGRSVIDGPSLYGGDVAVGIEALQDGFGALFDMQRRYRNRIWALRQDEERWRKLRPRGDLIDWHLLSAMVAINLRSTNPPTQREVASGPLRFMQELSEEIAAIRNPRREVTLS